MNTQATACGVGVDFGTTNSAVTLYDGKSLIKVDFPYDGGQVVPSAIYINRLQNTVVGAKAVDTYLKENQGRLIQLTKKQLDDLDVYTGEGTFTFQIHAWVDNEMPGRLFRGLKRWLGTKDLESIFVFGQRQNLAELLGMILTHLGFGFGLSDGERVYCGRPVRFGGDNVLARERLSKAAVGAGYSDVVFYPEPVAAALSYLHENRKQMQGQLLCFDFGGGTLDLCVLSVKDGSFRILATHGIPLGGDLIDQLIYRDKLFPEIGEDCPLTMTCLDGSKKPYRFKLLQYEDGLLNWQLSHTLNQPSFIIPLMKHMAAPGETGLKFRRLHSLIRGNHSYRILKAIEQAKVELSSATRTSIEVPELELSVSFTRAEMDACLRSYLEDISQCVHAALEKAGVSAQDVHAVVCTGGSSRIPAVRQLLGEMFAQRVVEHDVFGGVSAGLAIAHYHGYEFYPST